MVSDDFLGVLDAEQVGKALQDADGAVRPSAAS
jgi:hypothetical protein